VSGAGGVYTVKEDWYARITVVVAFIALLLGGVFGVLQVISRTPYWPNLYEMLARIGLGASADELYYRGLTAHGVLLAIVLTTFYIVGISAYLTPRVLGINIRPVFLNVSLAMMVVGLVIAAIAIVLGWANVLYTFYLPLVGHPFFYLGAALLILGSWVFAAGAFLAFLEWRKANPGVGIPLVFFGILTAFIVWIMATTPLVFIVLKNHIPASLLGWSTDALESRLFFWWFGHALVYFWLVPAITLWYYYVPKALGVPLFSETMAKVAFALFILASTPVGLHHQFADPGVNPYYKYIQTFLTLVVASPSMLTAFNIIATMERGGRARGGEGLLGWIFKQPWRDPVYLGLVLAFVTFGNGGITGIINASYQLNNVVHNTTWVVGHFHTTVGTAVALTFMVYTFILLRELYGRELILRGLAPAVPLLWFIGMMIFSLAYYAAGLEGAPRRTSDPTYGGFMPAEWALPLQIGAIGGLIFAVGGLIFLVQFFGSLAGGARIPLAQPATLLLNPHPPGRATILDRISLLIVAAIILNVLAYSGALIEIYSRGLQPVPPLLP